MTNCNMKRGFFFLRDCDHPARETCCECGKAFCSEHLKIHPEKQAPVCLDCLGKQMQTAKDQTRYNSYNRGSLWCYGYRHNYYDDGYHPFYSGRNHERDEFFDQYDVRSFDNGGNEIDNEDFDAEASTFDS